MNILPPEIISQIFEYCTDIKSIINIGLVSKEFNEIVNMTHEIKLRCMFLGKITKFLLNYNPQIIKSEKISIADKDYSIYSDNKRITSLDFNNYIKAINTTPTKELNKIFNDFKEDVIDTIYTTQTNKLIEAHNLLEFENNNKTELFRIDNILEKAKNRLIGDLFLYPNSISLVGVKFNDKAGRVRDTYGFEEVIPCLQVWITSSNCDNWPRHDHPVFGYCGIDEYLPGELFLGKKEGDYILLPFKGKELKLYCRQLPFRYGSCNFEDMVLRVSSSYGGICSENYYNPPISQKEQIRRLKEFHEKYKMSIAS